MQSRKVFAVAEFEYRTNFRRWGYRLATFGLPILAALVTLGLQWLSHRPNNTELITVDVSKPIGVLDQAHFLPQTLPEGFERVPSLEEGKKAVRSGQLLAVVVIPAGYPQTDAPLDVYTDTSMVTISPVVDERLTFLMAYAHTAGRLSEEELEALFTPPDTRYISLSSGEGGQAQSANDFFSSYLLSVLYFISLFTVTGYLLQSVAGEKESRIVEVLLSSLTTSELLAGKLLGLGALGLTQIAVWGVSAVFLFNHLAQMPELQLSFTPQFLAIALVVLLAGFLLFGILMAGLGSLGNNLRESQQYSAFFSILAVSPFMVNTLFFLNPNGLVPRVMSYFPWTAPIALLLRLSITPLPWWDIALSLFSIAVGVVISAWAGLRLFRVGILMFGKRPSWKEIWHILKSPA
ncbi:MAG: ABC transporter permease [Chloroflexi bacterium]|nr:ABC transporter permease [Chloroflexota bacterium]